MRARDFSQEVRTSDQACRICCNVSQWTERNLSLRAYRTVFSRFRMTRPSSRCFYPVKAGAIAVRIRGVDKGGVTSVFELWFDFSCPYAYLGWTQAEALAERTGATLDLRPMLLGGVFRARNVSQTLFAELGEAKARHAARDLSRYAEDFGVPLHIPSGHPFRTVEALRALLVVGPPWAPLVDRLFRAYWVENLDIGNGDVLTKLLDELGYDGAAVLRQTQGEEVKADLRRRTDEAIEKGVFGAPAFFVGGTLYWGQDRLDMVEAALGGSPSPLVRGRDPVHPVAVFYDYSSPFSYIGVTLAERVFGDRARWRPFLLGGLFKAIGTPNVPLLEMSEAKRTYMAADVLRQAERAGVPFSWPTRFPMNTVLALRMTLAAGAGASEEGRQLIHRIYQAYWGHDRDISDPDVLADLVPDGRRYLERATDPAVKAELRQQTEAAQAAGVFGAPSFVVRPEQGDPALFWGADRIHLAARAAAGEDRLL